MKVEQQRHTGIMETMNEWIYTMNTIYNEMGNGIYNYWFETASGSE